MREFVSYKVKSWPRASHSFAAVASLSHVQGVVCAEHSNQTAQVHFIFKVRLQNRDSLEATGLVCTKRQNLALGAFGRLIFQFIAMTSPGLAGQQCSGYSLAAWNHGGFWGYTSVCHPLCLQRCAWASVGTGSPWTGWLRCEVIAGPLAAVGGLHSLESGYCWGCGFFFFSRPFTLLPKSSKNEESCPVSSEPIIFIEARVSAF